MTLDKADLQRAPVDTLLSRSLDHARRRCARADELPKGRHQDFAAYCGQCLEVMRRARSGFRRGVACTELA